MTATGVERIPPNAPNSEAYLISAMLNDPQSVSTIMASIDSDDFYRKAFRQYFDVMRELYNESSPIDMCSVYDRLQSRGIKDEVQKTTPINDVAGVALTGANAAYHIEVVRNYSITRKVLTESQVLQDQIYQLDKPDVLGENIGRMLRHIASSGKKISYKIQDAIDESLAAFIDYYEGRTVPNIKTNWSMHDRMLGGFAPGQLIIVGARPGMGKSQYVINLARKISTLGKRVYLKSYEMSRMEIAERFVNMNSPMSRLFKSEKDKPANEVDADFVKNVYANAQDNLQSAHIIIDENAGDDTVKLKGILWQEKLQRGLDLVIIDYLQLIRKNKDQSRAMDPMGEMSRSLKLLAKELNVPIIALSQLNRELTKRSDRRPRLEDLRESGAIEQDADSVLLLHRDDYYAEENDDAGIMEVIVAKNRHGKCGVLKVFYDRRSGIIAEVDEYANQG